MRVAIYLYIIVFKRIAIFIRSFTLKTECEQKICSPMHQVLCQHLGMASSFLYSNQLALWTMPAHRDGQLLWLPVCYKLHIYLI